MEDKDKKSKQPPVQKGDYKRIKRIITGEEEYDGNIFDHPEIFFSDEDPLACRLD